MPAAAQNPRLLALIVASAIFMGVLDSTIITTALPAMGRSFAVSPVELSLGITVYILVMAVFLPVSSWFADRLGARTVLAGAILGFTVASVLCGLAQTLWEFVGARVLQALAATLMTPVGYLVLLRSAEKKDLVSVMAIATTPALIAPVLGPPIGGILITFLSWRWVFFLNIPIGLIGAALVLRYIPNLKSPDQRPFDAVGFVITGIALACLIYGLDRISAAEGDRRVSAALLAIGLLAGAWAVVHARRHPFPIAPLNALARHTFRTTNLTGGAIARVQLRVMGFVLPVMFQVGMGMSAFMSGILLLGFNGGDLMLKSVANQALRAVGFRTALSISAVLSGLSAFACAAFGAATPVWALFVVLVLAGAARSILFSGVMALTYADVPAEDIGGATVLNNVLSNVVGALSISLAAVVMNLAAAARGAAPGALAMSDFRLVLILTGVLGVSSVISFLRLPRDAGAEVSGHGAKARLVAAEAERAAAGED